jgi:hypothetical protein
MEDAFVPTVNDYLNSALNIELYTQLEDEPFWAGIWAPLELFNLLHREVLFFVPNAEDYVKIKEHYQDLGFTGKELYFFLYPFLKLIKKAFYNEDTYCGEIEQMSIALIKKMYDKADAEIFPLRSRLNTYRMANVFDRHLDKDNLGTVLVPNDKLFPYDPTDEKAVANLLKNEGEDALVFQPLYKLLIKKGVTADLIRILNVLYEMEVFEVQKGQVSTKASFMKNMGDFLGVDLSDYHVGLGQAYSSKKIETNFKIFETMKKKTSALIQKKL